MVSGWKPEAVNLTHSKIDCDADSAGTVPSNTCKDRMAFHLCQFFCSMEGCSRVVICSQSMREVQYWVQSTWRLHGSARNGPRNRSCQWDSRLVIWSRPTRLLFTPAAGRRYYSEKRRDLASPSDSIRVASYRMSTQSPTPNPYAHPSFFPTHALVRAPCLLLILLIILLFLAGPRVCGYWSGNGRGALHESA